MKRNLAMAGGALAGAAIAAYLHDRAADGTLAVDVGSTLRDLGSSASGLVGKAKSAVGAEEEAAKVDDPPLARRVRQAIMEATDNTAGILIDTEQGVVTLRGPVLEMEETQIVQAAKNVSGVVDVTNRMEAHPTAKGVEQLEITADEHEKGGVSPNLRLLAGAAAGALAVFGAAQRGPWGTAARVAGMGVLTRTIANKPLTLKSLLHFGGE